MSTIFAVALASGLVAAIGVQADGRPEGERGAPSSGPFTCSVGDTEVTLTQSADAAQFAGTLALAGDYAGMGEPERITLDARYEGWRHVFGNEDMTLVAGPRDATLYGAFGMSECELAGIRRGEGLGRDTPVSGTAFTWGGNVRAGPGEETTRLAGVPMGQEVELLARSDAPYWLDAYPWFRIRLPDGREGYIAGGLLCSLERAEGMFNDRNCGQ